MKVTKIITSKNMHMDKIVQKNCKTVINILYRTLML